MRLGLAIALFAAGWLLGCAGPPTGDHDECPRISEPIVGIAERLDPAVDLMLRRLN